MRGMVEGLSDFHILMHKLLNYVGSDLLMQNIFID